MVPTPQRLFYDRDEGNYLLSTELFSYPTLVLVGHRHCMARCCGCPCPGRILERVGDSDVQGGVKPASPVREERIRRHPGCFLGEEHDPP